jgi:hypothetical protein
VVVLPSGSWFAAVASLESTGVPGNEVWRGTVTSDHMSGLWDVMTAGRAVLHLPDDWRGEFASPRLEGADGQTLRVIGYGPAPF